MVLTHKTNMGFQASPKRDKSLEAVADHIQHVCELAGSSRHAAIGSDLDGGFGLERSPAGLETVADVTGLAQILTSRDYSEEDVGNILGDNWLRLLSSVLP